MNAYYSLKNSSLLEAIHPSSPSAQQKSADMAARSGLAGNGPSLPASYASSPSSTDHHAQCANASPEPPGHAFVYSTPAGVPMSVLGEPQTTMDDSGAYYHYLACSTGHEATKLAGNRETKLPGFARKPSAPASAVALPAPRGSGHGGLPPYPPADLLDPIESSVFYWWLDELGQPQPMAPASTAAAAAGSGAASSAQLYMYNGSPFTQPYPVMNSVSPAFQGPKNAPPSQSFFYPQAQSAMAPFHTRALTPSFAPSSVANESCQGSDQTMVMSATPAGSSSDHLSMSCPPSPSTVSPSHLDGISDSGRPLRKRTYKKTRLTEAQKRDNHLASEQKRRGHYKNAVESLISILPKPGHGEMDRSQCHLIWRAVYFIRSLEQGNQSLIFQLQQPFTMASSQSPEGVRGNGPGRAGAPFITM